jgi:rhodanese-related sulfurtransferase
MAAQHSPRFEQLCEAARARIRAISATELVARQAEPAPLHLIDVREDHEWALGHLPFAEHLGKGIIERDIERRIPDLDAEIVLYCGGGYRSALATSALNQMGYTRVRSLAGGFRGWQEAGRPIVDVKVSPTDLMPRS